MNDLIDRELDRLLETPLMGSDSQGEVNLLKAAVQQQLSPRDFLEQMWASELTETLVEMLRLRRYKKEIITSARVPALCNLLGVIYEGDHHQATKDLAHRYHTNKTLRQQIDRLLGRYSLTKDSIEAEAFRLTLADVTCIDQRLAELTSRRDKILQRLDEHRAGLAQPVQSQDRLAGY